VKQLDLLPTQTALPEGFVYREEFISVEQERDLINRISRLDFVAPTMHGVAARRRTVHFGHSYEFDTFKLGAAPPIPDFLLTLRDQAAAVTSANGDEFVEVLASEYPPGAPIGWHRDAPQFGIIVGISLLAACTMKFRPWPVAKDQRSGPRPLLQPLAPRSIYVLAGEARSRWQHHIPPVKELRYSVTFRTLRRA
jgi:alkylated DNA repair dioxygenase AlkB